jgi:septation ring formation regulator EzrA
LSVIASALDRLSQAIGQLENSVDNRLSNVATVEQSLRQELAEAHEREAEAAQNAENLARRLDTVIRRLEGVLEV